MDELENKNLDSFIWSSTYERYEKAKRHKQFLERRAIQGMARGYKKPS